MNEDDKNQASTEDSTPNKDTTDAPNSQPNDTDNNKPADDNKPNGDKANVGYTPFAGISPDDVADFLKLKADTGTPIDLDNSDVDTLNDLTAECRSWIRAGKPQAVMPSITKSSDKVQSVYRVRHHGAQYLFYYTEDSDPPVGVDRSNIYRKYRENGKIKIDRNVPVGVKDFYTIHYTTEKCEELIERCRNESDDPKFYIKEGSRVFGIKNPSNMTKDFDKTLDKVTSGKITV